MTVAALDRDSERCPWPEKVPYVNEASALRTVQWRRRKHGDLEAYRCPCHAWHTGRPPKAEGLKVIFKAGKDSRPEDLVWTRSHCEWCWRQLVIGRHRNELIVDELAFCNGDHDRRFHAWKSLHQAPVEVEDRLCEACGSVYQGLLNTGPEQRYCGKICAAAAKRKRRKMARLQEIGAVLIAQSSLPRQDPEVICTALRYIASSEMLPWPEVELVTEPSMPEPRIEIVADTMPARIIVGTGPMQGLDWAARDAQWIVWDGYAGAPGLRQVAEWAKLRPPDRLRLHADWILAQLEPALEGRR